MHAGQRIFGCVIVSDTTNAQKKSSETSRPDATGTQVLCRRALQIHSIAFASGQYLGISSHNIKNSPFLARLRRKICRRTFDRHKDYFHTDRDLVKYLNGIFNWIHARERAHILMSGAGSRFGGVIIALGLASVERKAAKCKQSAQR